MNRKEKTAFAGFIGNIILGAGKTWLSLVSGSTALLADALHSFSDVLVSVLVFFGLKTKRKKIESIVSLFVGLAIISIAIVFALDLFFGNKKPISRIPFVIAGQIKIIALTFLLYQYKDIIGKEEDSEGLRADGAHTKADMLSSVGVLISLTGHLVGLNLDRLAAFIIFFLIFEQGLQTVVNSILSMAGYGKVHVSVTSSYTWAKNKFAEVPGKIKFFIFFTAVVLLYLSMSVYTVPQGSIGIRKIAGHIDKKEIEPGLHLNLIFPISRIQIVDVTSINELTYGFEYGEVSVEDVFIHQMETTNNSRKYKIVTEEEEVLTGDGSLASIQVIVEYKIEDPFLYLLETVDPEKVLRLETGAALRKATGTLEIFEVINGKREDLSFWITEELNRRMDSARTGLEIQTILFLSVTPHRETLYMFRNVLDEEQNKNTLIFKAQEERSRQIPYYRGLSYEKIEMARAEGERIRSRALSDTALYKLMEQHYSQYGDSLTFNLELDNSTSILRKSEKILMEGSLDKDLLRIGGKH